MNSTLAPFRAPLLRRIVACALIACSGVPAGAQDSKTPSETEKPTTPATKLEDLPPPVRLGLRVQQLQQAIPVAPVVVIVRDPRSYLDALSAWSPKLHFPVLIDDGTILAHEDIARFVRAFTPERVMRWTSRDAEGDQPWTPVQRTDITSAFVAALGLQGASENRHLLQRAFEQVQSPGVVVTHEQDPAWPAALALAAGRLQPLLWAETPKVPRDPNSSFPAPDAEAFCTEIERGVASLGLKWRDLGDTIEGVTLCLNVPARIEIDSKTFAATTDRVGRLKEGGVGPLRRWAWAGQIIGSPSQAAYRAMCALFLNPTSAWLFDGYETTGSWRLYNARGAETYLKAMKFTYDIMDGEQQGARDWRLRAARPLDAGLVLVNTMGNCDFFDLRPGQCKPGDVPILARPAMVHFIHSWSAQFPARRDTVAQRWLERGAYAYLGSVQEPFLSAFVPTPQVVARLGAPAPWGASTRVDGAPLWKIAVFGDPLLTIGRDRPRAKGSTLPLESPSVAGTLRAIADEIAPAVKERRFADALTALTLTGRDADAKDLAAAILKEDPSAFTSDVARSAVLPLFRGGLNREVLAAFARLDDKLNQDGTLRDALWLAAYPLMPSGIDDAGLETLRDAIRDEQPERDAAELAAAWSKKKSRGEARDMLQRLKDAAKSATRRDALERALEALPAR